VNRETDGGGCCGEFVESCGNGMDGTCEVDVIYNCDCGEAEVLSGGVEDGFESEAEKEGAEDTALPRPTL